MSTSKEKTLSWIDELLSSKPTAESAMPSVMGESVKRWNEAKGDYNLRVNSFDLSHGDVVFDVGAYQADWSSRMSTAFPGINLVAFEPVEKYCEDFVSAMAGKDYTLHRVGLSDHSGELFIDETGLSTSLASEGSTKIIVDDIRKYVSGFEKVSVLKLNIEGSEYPCLNALIDSSLISRIDNIIVQFHPVDNSTSKSYEAWGSLAKRLVNTHNVEFSYPFIWEKWVLR